MQHNIIELVTKPGLHLQLHLVVWGGQGIELLVEDLLGWSCNPNYLVSVLEARSAVVHGSVWAVFQVHLHHRSIWQ